MSSQSAFDGAPRGRDNRAVAPLPAGGERLPDSRESGQLGYPTQAYSDRPEQGDDLAATLYFYLRIVSKRRWLILAATLLATTIAALITLMQTPLYTATVRIQIESQSIKVVEGDAPADTRLNTGADFLRTQYELLKSRGLAERTASALQLQSDDDFLKPRSVSAFGLVRSAFASSDPGRIVSPLALQAAAISVVQTNVAIRPVPGSRLVDIIYKDPNPARAERISNAYADAYIASNLDKRFQANAYAKTFLEDQIAQLKIRLEQAEKAMLDFAEREQIVSVGERASISETNLAAANTTLGQLVTERIKTEQLWKQLEASDGITIPQLLSNSVIDGLRARRNTLQTEYKEKLETFKPDYPDMLQISSKIREIDRQLASEVATIRQSYQAAFEAASRQEQEMRARVEALRGEVIDLQRRGVQHSILQREVETIRNLYNSLLQRLKEVDVASGVGTNNIFIVDRAQRPGSPSEPRLSIALLLGFAIGLGGGLGAAYLMELLDDRVRVPEDLEELTGLATLGIIPALADEEAVARELADPRSAISEAYRSLATALQFSTDKGLPRAISVTSAGAGEGKSSTAIAISRHFASMGMRVLLVDGDLRKPSLHTKLDRDNSIGLSNYLTGAMTPPETFQDSGIPNLTLMASGPLPPNGADLLAGTRIFSLVTVGLEIFDLIVIDGPPLLGLADAQLLANATDATIFVAASGQQSKGQIRYSLRRLAMTRSRVIGTVMTKFDAKSAGYGYGYGYGYRYDYSAAYGAGAYQYGVSSPTDTKAIQAGRKS
ncbi:MAG: GumC family protein [Hyphomicrobiaceae bacterium]